MYFITSGPNRSVGHKLTLLLLITSLFEDAARAFQLSTPISQARHRLSSVGLHRADISGLAVVAPPSKRPSLDHPDAPASLTFHASKVYVSGRSFSFGAETIRGNPRNCNIWRWSEGLDT